MLEFAEIAYSSGDMPLAVKTFLMAVDMTDDEESPITSYQTDITLRAWYGVKLVRHVSGLRGGTLTNFTEFTPHDIRHTIAISNSSPSQCGGDWQACNGTPTTRFRTENERDGRSQI